MKRMILEGMDRDNTKLNYIVGEQEIKDESTTLITEFAHYKLDLVGRIDTEGNFLESANLDSIEQIICGGIVPESIQTIILEDGRVYSWANRDRLEATLTDLKHAGGFESAYRQIYENPRKFYR